MFHTFFASRFLLYRYSGWFCVFLVAISTGITGGLIDIATKWMSNLKNGMCLNAFWLDKEQCCWSSLNQTRDIYDNIKCSQVRKKKLATNLAKIRL